MKTKIVSLIIVAGLFISTAVFAQPAHFGNKGDRNSERKAMIKNRMAQQKGEKQTFLTFEQKETINNLRLESLKKVKPLKNELREMMAHQQTLTTANKADLKAINKNIDKMAVAKADIAKIMAGQKQQVRALLTDEQLLKFDSMNGKRGNRSNGNFMQQHIKNGDHRRSGKRS